MGRDPGNIGHRIVRNFPSGSSTALAVNDGADYAFNPKEFSRSYPAKASTHEEGDSPEFIEDRIKRLSQTLANKALVSRLPDKGGRIQKQIAELNTQLHDIRNSGSKPDLERKEQEVIDVDDLTKDLQNLLSV